MICQIYIIQEKQKLVKQMSLKKFSHKIQFENDKKERVIQIVLASHVSQFLLNLLKESINQLINKN
jgi:hypothetical protein